MDINLSWEENSQSFGKEWWCGEVTGNEMAVAKEEEIKRN